MGPPDDSIPLGSPFYKFIRNSINCNDLDIFYTNADPLLNKRDNLNVFISGNEPDVILITEVLPKVHSQFVTQARLSLTGYSIFTNFDFESPSTYHGIRGVAIYVSHKLSAKEVNFNQDSLMTTSGLKFI